MEFTATVNEVQFDVSFEISTYTPARLYGAPENCSPEEGGEITFDYICLDGKDVWDDLSADVVARIEEQCYEYAENVDAKDAEDAYADYLRECREDRLAA
jgi:hypothetical protein